MFNFFRRFSREGNHTTFSISPEQEAFNKASAEAWQSGYREVGKGKNALSIETTRSELSEEAILIMSPIVVFKTSIVDHEKINKAQNEVQRRFEKEIYNGKIAGGIGGFAPDGYYPVVGFLVGIVLKWTRKHLLSDVDSQLWKIIKVKFLDLYEKVLKLDKPDGKIALVTSYMPNDRSMPTIVFLLPPSMRIEEFARELDNVIKITRETINDYVPEKGIATYEYSYNASTRSWILKTSGFSMD